ncbi:alpha/beta fold hydrolase [Aquihabitans sp. G128]|uniref:alpha/beta fold hydrolase n=1 Tax=Aquihabitans sp. G128 TaxID=2849779 RepID=UPI001C2168E6|nr:alpha/beta hydrolase [Aquihabitans sp. G128]QXC62675.1 alpha/beta fold hydrolase [Aquihabitans sp. G128]
MSAVPTAAANGIEIAYEAFGDPADPTILLVMGLGAQMLSWDEGFCALLVARGHHVVRFDNRDIGQSTWIDTPDLDVPAAVLAAFGGDRSQAPYLLSDMAADAIGLLDHLDVDAAHVVGASMGGMIAQTLAIEHPGRVRSLTSIMSTTGEPTVGAPDPEILGVLVAERPQDLDASIEFSVEMARAIASPDHFDADRARARAVVEHQRGINRLGVPRQLLAIVSSGDRADGLSNLDLPALVVHGRQDRLVGFSGGQRTAELVAGADFVAIDDMAHDLPVAHWPRIADAITAVTHRAR